MPRRLSRFLPALRYGAVLDDTRFSDLGDLLDANGNEIVELDAVASAVNNIRIANAAASGGPTITAVGDDTNINLLLAAKGTGMVTISGGGSATASAGAASVNSQIATITSEALTTAAGATYTLTVTSSRLVTTTRILLTIGNGTNTQGLPTITTVTAGTGSYTAVVLNAHASQALNGTLKFYHQLLS